MKCCDLSAGKLRHTIELERLKSVPDGAGGWSQKWVSQGTLRAMMKPVSGRERMEYERLESVVTFRCVIRFRSDIRASDRIRYNGRVYNIRYIYDIEERRKWLELELGQGEAA